MGDLTREQILAAQDLPTRAVDVPEWGGRVHVRVMNGAERDEFDDFVIKRKGDIKGLRLRLAALCLCSPDGQRLFSEEDVEALSKKSGKAIQIIEKAATELNGLNVDAAEKNSESGQDV